MADAIEIRGVAELNRAFDMMGREADRELADVSGDMFDLVVRRARPLIPVRTGNAAASLKVRRSTEGATIEAGGGLAPYYGWLDYGGRVGRRRSVAREYIPGGRFLSPTLRDAHADFEAATDAAVARLADRAGIGTAG